MSSSWPDILKFPNNFDGALRLGFVVVITFLVITSSLIFEEKYVEQLIILHDFPWWRMLVVLLVILGALWCPRVGIVLALLVTLYLADIDMLKKPFIQFN
jgi:hypothetical protein